MLVRSMEPYITEATIQRKPETSEKDDGSPISSPDKGAFVPEEQSSKDDRTSVKRPYKSSHRNSSFIEKLWEVLHTPAYREAIHWSKDGQSFRIEPKLFYETSLNTNAFNGCRFESFLRRLLRWGFERVILEGEFPINAFVYQHASFKSGEPNLMQRLDPPKGAKTEAKKPTSRKKPKKTVSAIAPSAPSTAPTPTPRRTMTEESKTASPSNALGATQQGIISHLMATREAAATSASLGAAGLDRINLLHSLGGNNSEPLSLLLSQRNQLTDLISRSFSSSLAGERTLLARQLLAQQDEEALLVTLLRNRSHMQTDALLRSNHLLTNSAAALALAPSRVLQSVPRFLTEHGRPSASNRNMFLPSLPLERRDSPPLSSTTILDAFRRGQLTLDEAETLLRRLS